MTESALEDMLDALARDPLIGDLIPETGGIRKLRWSTGRDGGKGGGVRVFYYAQTNLATYLLMCVPKREDKPLTAERRAAFRRAILAIDHTNVVKLSANKRDL